MNPSESRPAKLTLTAWLVLIIASIGFLFDTYELLMTPLVAAPAIAELLKIPLNNPIVTDWVGRLLWISALCGGVFGLLGGWLVDKLGRKRVMALSIFLYSLSPFFAAFSTSLPMFVFFRSTTFIGMCVVFLPAIPIALLLPFVPESKVWREKRAAGTLKRPSFAQLFAPELRRITLVTAVLSACAYGIAFGALQVTVARVTPGLPELKQQAAELAPLRKQAEALNRQFNALPANDPARKDLLAQIKENFVKQKPINDV